MAPSNFVLFEDEFAAHLVEVASFQNIPARSDFLDDRFDRVHQHRSLHVFRALASQVQGSGHSKQIVYLLGRVGVYGKWTICLLGIEGDQIRLPTPNYDNFGGRLKLKKRLGCDG